LPLLLLQLLLRLLLRLRLRLRLLSGQVLLLKHHWQ
jgi:hypothetical protein